MDEVRRLLELAADLRRLAADEPDQAARRGLLDLADRSEATANHLGENGSGQK
jgi:hypothetical protein